MAVVINEFELVPGEINRDQNGSSSSDAAEKVLLSAREIELMVEQRLERDERVWAY
jgi:hypothetical protein